MPDYTRNTVSGEGLTDQALLYRESKPALRILQPGPQWSFTANRALFDPLLLAEQMGACCALGMSCWARRGN